MTFREVTVVQVKEVTVVQVKGVTVVQVKDHAARQIMRRGPLWEDCPGW